MTAQELLHHIESAGGITRIKTENGVVKLNVAPREVAIDFAAEIKKFKPALLELLASKPVTGIPISPQNLRKPQILSKWHSRHIHLWLGTTTQDGIEYRTLEYEADKSIPSKWLKELEAEKHDIQLALVAQEVRDLSARYWESRKAEVEAVRIERAEYPEAFEQRPIDWPQIEQDRAMQDALSAKLGPLKAIQAILRASNEILSLWTPKGRKESPETLQRAALELLCIRHEIDFENMFDSEMADDEETTSDIENTETPITTETEFEGWYRLSEEHFPTEEDYFETATVIEGELVSLGNAFIRVSTGKAWMHESMHVELEWEFTHWRHYEDDNVPIAELENMPINAPAPSVIPKRSPSSAEEYFTDLISDMRRQQKGEVAPVAPAPEPTAPLEAPETLSLEFEMFGDLKK